MTIDPKQFEGHTPGPWELCNASNGGCKCGLVWSKALDFSLASVDRSNDTGGISDEMFQANKRLIAAAPDLLAALASVIEERDRLRGERQGLFSDLLAATAEKSLWCRRATAAESQRDTALALLREVRAFEPCKDFDPACWDCRVTALLAPAAPLPETPPVQPSTLEPSEEARCGGTRRIQVRDDDRTPGFLNSGPCPGCPDCVGSPPSEPSPSGGP